jgi:hypothetical protein
MTDAKEPLVIEYLRQEARDGSEFLYDVYGGVVCATSMVLDGFDTLTRERDEARAVIEAAKALKTQLAAERAVVEAAKTLRDASSNLGNAVDALRALEGDV